MCTYKELEACFQSNIDRNFPRNLWNPRPFDDCFIEQRPERWKSHSYLLLRFSFPDQIDGRKTKLISSIELISIRGMKALLENQHIIREMMFITQRAQ